MLLDLQVEFFIFRPIIESFEEVFMRHLAVGYIIIYYITIILNALDNVVSHMELRVVEGWST